MGARSVSGPLLLADISGYTSFLQDVASAHRDDAFIDGIPDAYAMMSDRLDEIVGRVVPPFTLAKLEGDAVFAFAVDDNEVPRSDAMLGCFRDCCEDFRSQGGLRATDLALPMRGLREDRRPPPEVLPARGALRAAVDHGRSRSRADRNSSARQS